MNNSEIKGGITEKLGINEVLAKKVHRLLTEQHIDTQAAGNTVTLTGPGLCRLPRGLYPTLVWQ